MDFEKLDLKERKIIVGIDFGTTYSGIAWAETRLPDRRTAINSWPISRANLEGKSSDKVPTKLRYTEDGTQWGFSIPPTAPQAEIIDWFKLGLGPSIADIYQERTVTCTSIVKMKDPDSLVTDYLTAMIDHFLYILRRKLGKTIVKATPLEFVVTVPAIWTESANQRTKRACERALERAQIAGPVHLVSEPEAAAIFALHGLDTHGLKVGDTMVVVDAGGGTVDLISYTVTALKPILEVKEAAPGSGALCGSVFVNAGFHEFFKSKLGKAEGFDDEVLADAMESFERIKKEFAPGAPLNDTYKIPVALDNNLKLGIVRGRFALKVSDVIQIFKPVVDQVIELVKVQIKQSNVPIKALLLVGGFGASAYLRERIRDAIDNSIEILQPSHAWQAIVQGAVMKGLAMVSVRGRVARKHFGIDLQVPYDEKIHSHKALESYWNGLYGKYYISTTSWFIERGHEVLENQPTLRNFVQWRPVADGRLNFVSCNILMDATSENAPVFRDDNVKLLATLKADVSSIPESQLSRRKGHDGQQYYVLEYSIELIYLSASTQYTLIYNDITKWSVNTPEAPKTSGDCRAQEAMAIYQSVFELHLRDQV